MSMLGLDAARRSEGPRIAEQRGRSIERRMLAREGLPGFLVAPVAAGVSVNQHTALSVSAYFCGINVISGDLGALELNPIRRLPDGDREVAASHPTFRIVHDEANPAMSAQTLWQTLIAHAISWGNGYAEIEWDNAMRPIGLWPIMPDRIWPWVETLIDARGRASSRLYYRYSPVRDMQTIEAPEAGSRDAGFVRLEAEDVLHIAGLGFDGIRGYSVVQLARQSLGLGMAAERFGASFFGNGAHPGLALEHPGTLSKEAQDRLIESTEARHQGADQAHRMIVLEEGMKVSKPLTIPPEDAQFLGTHDAVIEDMARWLNCPVRKLKRDVGAGPGGTDEHSELDYQMTTLEPWSRRIINETKRKLIPRSQWSIYNYEHNWKQRLKADTATRMQAHKELFAIGAVDADGVADAEGLPKPAPVALAGMDSGRARAIPAVTTIVASVAAGEIPRDSGIGQLVVLFNLSQQEAKQVMGSVGEGFEPKPALAAPPAPIAPVPDLAPAETAPAEPAAEDPNPSADPASPTARHEAARISAERDLVLDRMAQYVRREAERVRGFAKKDPGGFERAVEEFYEREATVLAEWIAPFLRFRMASRGVTRDSMPIAKALAGVYVERSREELGALKAKSVGPDADRLAHHWEKTRAAELADKIMAIEPAEETSNA